jgi:2'-5' RNA ligase
MGSMQGPSAAGSRPKRRYFDRLFFAVFPEARIAAQIESSAKQFLTEHSISSKPLAANRFHVSLNLVDESDGLSSDVVAKASSAADTVHVAPFEISLNQVTTFQRKNGLNQPLVLLVDEGKAQLRTLLSALLSGLCGFPVVEKSILGFKPHLTLLYSNQSVTHQIDSISWTVRDFALVHSLVGRTQYKILGRWPLDGRAPVQRVLF